ncbi:MAG TPA: NRDE family protein [Syntrophomonadaceae bacterium]|nr:NRDE family protein [Syntrophomonadaceae bacterium]
MCLILFAHDCHPRYQLVVAANRDEFYQRPTLPANYWPDAPHILAGRDLQEGGTWMGVTTTGRFAALTNYRDPSSHKVDAPSRGHLVENYLRCDLTPVSYLESLPEGGAAYNGFNLLLAADDSMYYYSNREGQIRKVEQGVHGLSNSLLNTPWPKVSRGIRVLTDILQDEDIKVERLFAMMTDQEQPEDQELPDTGVGLEMERMLAPIFVTSPNYGTRLTTVILVGRDNRVRFWERSYLHARPDEWDEVHYDFKLETS